MRFETSFPALADSQRAGQEVLTIFVSASGSSMAQVPSTAGCSRRRRCLSPPPAASEQPRPERAARRPAGGLAAAACGGRRAQLGRRSLEHEVSSLARSRAQAGQ